jgi:hypothetical protein
MGYPSILHAEIQRRHHHHQNSLVFYDTHILYICIIRDMLSLNIKRYAPFEKGIETNLLHLDDL